MTRVEMEARATEVIRATSANAQRVGIETLGDRESKA